MATKRDYYNIDPDYEDVSEEQNKRQRLIEKDAKEETIRKIENIIRKEITREIHTREDELNHIDQSIYQARHLLDRLRACLVANYYSSAKQGTLSQDNSPSTSAPFIHPTVKKYLGKHPPTSRDSEERQDSEKETWQDSSSSTDKPSLSNGSNESGQAATTTSSDGSSLASHSGFKSATQSNSNGGRTSRFRIKKKIIVGNASKFIPLDRREDNDPSTHKWLIYVRGPKEEPQIDHFVKKVWFFLHPSYRPNDLVEIVHPPFHLSRRGWGEFPVRVQLHFYDQRNKRVDIIHQLKLDRTYTGLQTLGAETTVEIEIEKENVFDRNASAVCSSNLPSASVSTLPCPVNNQSLTTSRKNQAEEHKTIVETTVHHSPIKKEPLSTEAKLALPQPCSTGQTDSTESVQSSKVAAGISSSPAKNIKTRELSGVSVAENTIPVMVSSLSGVNPTGPSTSNYAETFVAVKAVTAPPKPTASLPSPIIITTPQKPLAPPSGVKIGPSLAGSNVPQAPYFVTLSSIANPKLSLPVVMTNTATRLKNPVITTSATSTTASSKQGSLQFSTTIPATKVQTLQGVPLNNLLKTLNSNSKVLWMSPPLLPQVRASKPTGGIPASSSASTSSSHLTTSAQSISSILLPPSSSLSTSSLITTQDKITSALFNNTIALTTTVSTASSSKCSPTESSTGAKLILAGDTTLKSLSGSHSFETRPVISSLDNNYITIQLNTNPADISQSGLGQKKITGLGDKIAPIKEGSPVISPFRVTPQGLVSIPSRISPSSTSVQATAAQISKTNPTSSVPVVHMSTGQQSASGALSSTFKSLGKLPTGAGTAPIILLSGTSVARTSAVITTTTTPIKKVATQQPQGLLIPTSSFQQSVVRPITTEVKNIPNKTSLLFLSPTANSSNLVKGAATSSNKMVYTSQPPTHNTMNVSVSAVHTHVLTSATSSSLAGNPPTSKVCFIQSPPQVSDIQKTTVGSSSQQLKCSVIGSNPSALTSSKQTYVLTTTKNKGLSLLPSHLVLKPGLESRTDATQSVLYKAAPTDGSIPTTQIVSSSAPSSAPAGLTLAPTRPMLLLKNQKAPMILTNQIGVNNSATGVTPTQMQILSANKATQQTSVISAGKDNDNSTMSLQLQYANGHLVLAPPTVRSALGNNVTGGQKIFLKVLPATTASGTIPATNGPKVVNGNSPLNIVSLTTPVTPASSISNTCYPISTSTKAAQNATPNPKPVKTVENEKRIHGYNKVKKSESAQPATVSLINLSCLSDMISLIRSAVRLHPLVAAKIDRSLHPYAAFTTDQWLSWNIGKRRASEWQRALSVRLYIIRLLNGATSFQGEKVWTTKQIFCWCRLHAYSPHHLEASSASKSMQDEVLSSATNSLLPLQPLSSFTSMAALEKRLEALEPQIQTPHTEDEIDIISTDFPKVRIKQEAESNSSQCQTTQNNIFLPVSDSAIYVQDVARQVGVNLKPTEVDDHVHGPVCEMMLFSGVQNLLSDILRTAFALKSKDGKYPTELSLVDIHAALSKIPGADFLTNTHLGLVSNPDTHSNDHHKQKHGIT